MKKPSLPRIETGVRNLDALLNGGLPAGSVTVFGGSPGAGKTILAQQICFHNANPKQRALWFSTLSEPMIQMLAKITYMPVIRASGMEKSPQGQRASGPSPPGALGSELGFRR